MPQSITVAAFVFGAVLILIGLLGGKFKIFGAEVSGTAGRGGRSFAAVAGTVLIVAGLFVALRPPSSSPKSQSSSSRSDPGTSTILSFQAAPSDIRERETTQLKWAVQGASSVVIDHGVGNVPLRGSRTVSPPASTVYTLTAGQGGATVQATTEVRVIALTWEEKNSIGALSGDEISSFRVVEYAQDHLTAELTYHYNPQHGQVWIGGYLLDENERSISRGFPPTSADATVTTQVRVIADPRKGRIQSKWVFFWIYESNKGEGFISKRFPYEHFWN